jgi:enhancing lycopene biosynthesis protein 2
MTTVTQKSVDKIVALTRKHTITECACVARESIKPLEQAIPRNVDSLSYEAGILAATKAITEAIKKLGDE